MNTLCRLCTVTYIPTLQSHSLEFMYVTFKDLITVLLRQTLVIIVPIKGYNVGTYTLKLLS